MPKNRPESRMRQPALPLSPPHASKRTWPSMPSAAPSSTVARNERPARAGSRNVGSATVRSVNHSVPPSARLGSCRRSQGRGGREGHSQAGSGSEHGGS